MCWAERFCYVVPANLGCVLVGISSFMLSLFALAISMAYFIIEYHHQGHVSNLSISFAKNVGLNLNTSSLHIVLSIAIILSVIWMLFSIMLIVGITRNQPNLVLSYFSFGIIVTIICQLSALLVLLQGGWILALTLFIMSLLHIHVLVVVHTVYELMSRGKDFRFRQHAEDEDPLADCFDDDINSI